MYAELLKKIFLDLLLFFFYFRVDEWYGGQKA